MEFRNCPAAVSGNERRHQALADIEMRLNQVGKRWLVGAGGTPGFTRKSASPKTCQRLSKSEFQEIDGRILSGRFAYLSNLLGKGWSGMLLASFCALDMASGRWSELILLVMFFDSCAHMGSSIHRSPAALGMSPDPHR